MVSVRDFRKRYGAFEAVKGIGFEVARGEVFALLGPNGAGKTSTLECLEGLRTRDIADRVGINIATLHYHVPSKEALIALVAESLCAEFRAQREKRVRAGLSPLQRLRLNFEGYREMLETKPDLVQVFAELLMRAKRDDSIRGVIEPQLGHWIGQLDEVLSAGVADGTFRPGNSITRAEAAKMVIKVLEKTEE